MAEHDDEPVKLHPVDYADFVSLCTHADDSLKSTGTYDINTKENVDRCG